ncbi:uncharacterized protein LOC114439978 [Parambassis ranga]|uniref:Uncharacterized protein LOC114439978 n=1 Tax=Parambassis ranga TaxID=210632 RepID=A0A6P7IR15_9TELE|nr:uncharacterized protein LOC114439978 [Parambassis ranga]
MASKKQRWNESQINTKTSKPAQVKEGKDHSAQSVCSGGKQAASSLSKSIVSSGRSSSLSSKGGDSTAAAAAAGKVGGSLKRGSLVSQTSAGHPATRLPSRPARPALRLSSSRSFSSLHTSSLTAAPFMRSSRSLNRLDQRCTSTDDSEVKKGNNTGKKILDSARLSASEEQIIRYKKDSDNAEKRKTSITPQLPESSSSLVPANASHYNKGNKQVI